MAPKKSSTSATLKKKMDWKKISVMSYTIVIMILLFLVQIWITKVAWNYVVPSISNGTVRKLSFGNAFWMRILALVLLGGLSSTTVYLSCKDLHKKDITNDSTSSDSSLDY